MILHCQRSKNRFLQCMEPWHMPLLMLNKIWRSAISWGAWLVSWALNNIAYIGSIFLVQNQATTMSILVVRGIVVSVLHFAVQNGFIAYCSTSQLQQNKAPLKKFNYQFLKNHLKKVWICSNSSSFYAKELLTKQQVRPVTKLFKRSLGRVKKKKKQINH